jgi:hypothetical protein
VHTLLVVFGSEHLSLLTLIMGSRNPNLMSTCAECGRVLCWGLLWDIDGIGGDCDDCMDRSSLKAKSEDFHANRLVPLPLDGQPEVVMHILSFLLPRHVDLANKD